MVREILDKLGFRQKQLLQEVELSQEAKQIWESPLVQEFFQKAEASILSKWKDSPDDAIDVRERLFVIHGILRNFQQHFKGYLINGEFAEKELEKIMKNS